MTEDELMEKVFNVLLQDDDVCYSKLDIYGGDYSGFIKSEFNRCELSDFIYSARDKDDLSNFCFDNPYSNMSDECKEFVDRYCKLIEDCKKE